MRLLIEDLFVRHLGNPLLDSGADAAALPLLPPDVTPMVTTDGFTVDPLEFPGGDIGSLAVHGTVNDLAVSGAEPRYLTLNCFLEEGLDLHLLDRLVASMAAAARESDVMVVAGRHQSGSKRRRRRSLSRDHRNWDSPRAVSISASAGLRLAIASW